MRTRIEAGSSASHDQTGSKITPERRLRELVWDTAAVKEDTVDYVPRDLIKVEFRNEPTGDSERMWLRLTGAHDG
jgi:hypothetical protein